MAEQVEPGHVIIDNDEEAVEHKMEALEALGMDYTVHATRAGTGMKGKPTYRWEITWRVPVVEGTDAAVASGIGSGPR